MHSSLSNGPARDPTQQFECDECGDAFENEGSFGEVWAEAKEEGWIARKDGDYWRHICPSCQEDKR